ncbi:zinc-binding alcohol dehydrogenase family protein [Planococcus shenhongbingii]|nr:zinc-binding alcohol dehydrogenase family protein [Planococcus sp. N016]WKA56914.1 zinc-binding alcohol dehydrogenase family protein [Planococcus sp. N016]
MSQEKMKALGFYAPGDRSKSPEFESVEIDRPVPTGRNLLVEVRAISVNPTDLRTRDAKKDNDDSLTIVGRDVAGVVVGTGENCSLFKTGDEVFYAGTSAAPGGQSELHLVDERIVGKKPQSLDFAQAAAMPLTSLTVCEALFDRLGISRTAADNSGKTILIIGAAGGVGSAATQIAKLVGLQVVGTASRKETAEWAREHGADHVINHREPIPQQLKELGLDGVQYIFCMTNIDDHMEAMGKVILPQGKVCSILPAQKPISIAFFSKSVTFVYELMYTRSIYQTEDMIEQHHYLNDLADWIDEGKMRSTLNKHFKPINIENLKQAYDQLLTGKTIGKIVIEGPFEQ